MIAIWSSGSGMRLSDEKVNILLPLATMTIATRTHEVVNHAVSGGSMVCALAGKPAPISS